MVRELLSSLVFLACCGSVVALGCTDLQIAPIAALINSPNNLTLKVSLGDEPGQMLAFCTSSGSLQVSPAVLGSSGSVQISGSPGFHGLGRLEVTLTHTRGGGVAVCNKTMSLSVWVQKTDRTTTQVGVACNRALLNVNDISVAQETTSVVYVRTVVTDCPAPFDSLENGHCKISAGNCCNGALPKLSSLDSWLRADSLGLTSGAAVAAWPDQSPVGRSYLLQGSGITYVPDAVNGRPVVRFTGAGHFQVASAYNLDVSAGVTIAVVAKATPGAIYYIWGWMTNAFQQQHYALIAGSGYLLHMDHSGVASYRSLDVSAEAPGAEMALHTFYIHGSSSTYRYNGAKVCTFNAGPLPAPWATSLGMGSIGAAMAVAKFQGDLAEMMVFKGPLTPSETFQVEQRLITKYGLTGRHDAACPA